jgi:hypothetical protein
VPPVDAVAVPEKFSTRLAFEASLANVTLPGVLPAVVGVNTTVNVLFVPAATVTGKLIPVKE